LYAWKLPADSAENVIRNQIDFVMFWENFRKYAHIKSAKTYPGADVNTVHNPVVVRFRMHRMVKAKQSPRKQIDVNKLKNKEFKFRAAQILEGKLTETEQELKWKQVKDAIIDVQQTMIGLVNSAKKQKWMTDSIRETMEKRRLAKGNEQSADSQAFVSFFP
jgi:hypothetical protein